MTAPSAKSLCLPRKAVPNYNDYVRIDVGTGDTIESFNVHSALLTARSPFFKQALTGNWKEAEDRIVKLPEDEPSLFSAYVHHLYTGELAVRLDAVEQIDLDYRVNGTYQNLCHLFVLAEKLQDIQTKNAIIQTILEIGRTVQSDDSYHFPISGAIRIIYGGTTTGSLARKLMVDLWTYHGREDWLGDDKFPADFLRDLVINLLDKRKPPADSTKFSSGSEYMKAVDKEKARCKH